MTALTAAFQSAPGLAGVTITQGSAPSAAGDPDFVIVGHDGSLDDEGALSGSAAAGSFTTEFITEGSPAGQEETGTINVVAVSQTGDPTDLPGRVTRAQALVTACDGASTDLRSGGIVFDGLGTAQVITRQYPQGCAAMTVFTVTYTSPW